MFNWPSQRTRSVRAFMGDAGSTMLGFSLAWISLELSQQPVRVISPVVALWVFALPIFDMALVVVSRMRRGLSPASAGNDHTSHRLIWL